MKYETGMFGGSFDPLHLGHLHDIIRAAGMCRELFVVISFCPGRESVPKEQIYRWIHYCTKHLSNVRILLMEDGAATKDAYNTDYYWEKGARDIKAAVGRKIDAVFCGTDYLGTGRFESLYGDESEVVYFDRTEVPVSSTGIRFDPYEQWEYLPPVCREYYAKRVLIAGSESTGKSTLAENLAMAYNTVFVREIGREVCDDAGGEAYMNMDDMVQNLIRQKGEELAALKSCNRLLFVDTDALTTRFYSEFLLSDEREVGKCLGLADAVADISRFDLVLFLEPTVAFIQDGTRNETIGADRLRYSETLKKLFLRRGMDPVCLDGSYTDRFNRAKEEIRRRLGIRTVW